MNLSIPSTKVIFFFAISVIIQIWLIIAGWNAQHLFHHDLKIFIAKEWVRLCTNLELPPSFYAHHGILAEFTIFLRYLFYSLFGVLAYFRPIKALYSLLVFLVLFGNRPATGINHILIFFSTAFIIGAYSHLFFKNPYLLKRFIVKFRLPNLTLMMIQLFLLTTLISLLNISLIEHILATPNIIISSLLNAHELEKLFSFSSTFFLWQAMLIGFYIYGITKPSNRFIILKNIFIAVLGGWSLFVIFGLLDFYGIYDLSWYRKIDTPGRLHSFFVNTTWSAEYIAITLPILPVILLVFLVFKRISKVALLSLIALVIIGTVTLILIMQRGAWLTYPATITIILISFFYAYANNKTSQLRFGDFLKRYWYKIFITIPLSAILAVLIIFILRDIRKSNQVPNARDTLSDLTARIGTITHDNRFIHWPPNRFIHWPPAFRFTLDYPIYGGGSDSFGWQYYEKVHNEKGIYHNTWAKTLALYQAGTSHNLYLQTLVGKGLPGLFFLVAFLFIILYKLIKNLFNKEEATTEKIILSLSVIGSLIATATYANVQEIFYTQPVAIIFWVVVFGGLILIENHRISYQEKQRFLKKEKIILSMLLALVPIHLILQVI